MDFDWTNPPPVSRLVRQWHPGTVMTIVTIVDPCVHKGVAATVIVVDAMVS